MCQKRMLKIISLALNAFFRTSQDFGMSLFLAARSSSCIHITHNYNPLDCLEEEFMSSGLSMGVLLDAM